MSTIVRPEVSKNNEYWIPRQRFYELKHFCLQYPSWKKVLSDSDSIISSCFNETGIPKTNNISKPVEICADIRSTYINKIDIVEKAAKSASEELCDYILKAVTEGYSYNYLKTKMNIPCCKETYYKSYRRFFWLLDIARK